MTTTPRLPALIDAATLDAHRGDPQLRIFDATVLLQRPPEGGPYEVVSGRAGYDAGHIPGAAFADLAGDLADPDSPFAFTLPSAERVRARGRRAGDRRGHARRRLRAVGDDVGDAAVVAAALLRLRRRLRARRRPAGVAGGRPPARSDGDDLPAGDVHRHATPRAAGDCADVEAIARGEAPACLVNALSPEVFRGEDRAPTAAPAASRAASACRTRRSSTRGRTASSRCRSWSRRSPPPARATISRSSPTAAAASPRPSTSSPSRSPAATTSSSTTAR